MKRLLLATLVVTAVRGAEEPMAAGREMWRAKIKEALPPFQPAALRDDKPATTLPGIFTSPPPLLPRAPANKRPEDKTDTDRSVVVMAPFVVAESKRDRAVEAAIARQTQNETFSPVKGGTLFDNGRVKVGGWWTESQGWSFLKLTW